MLQNDALRDMSIPCHFARSQAEMSCLVVGLNGRLVYEMPRHGLVLLTFVCKQQPDTPSIRTDPHGIVLTGELPKSHHKLLVTRVAASQAQSCYAVLCLVQQEATTVEHTYANLRPWRERQKCNVCIARAHLLTLAARTAAAVLCKQGSC